MNDVEQLVATGLDRLVLEPGDYELRMDAVMRRGTCTGIYELENAALSYLLLGPKS